MKNSLDAWFAREILAHEAALVRYLARMWHSRDDVHDLRQETYLRVYEAAARSRPHSARAFLFTTARHLITDLLRRKRVVPIESGLDPQTLDVLVDEMSPERHTGADQELHNISRAFDRLPPRCREVVWLRKVEGCSQKEIAAKLGIGESVVEKHIAKAMRRFADALFGEDASDEGHDGPVGSQHGRQPYTAAHRSKKQRLSG